ncbi:FtsK/SpoIIIE domain-containing protein [Hamadaea sp. NPDC051192]|uniref:type IV secretory system conjugative DNA transfer family protein n=1 Tax=Hamadaea sp. NPDC051192 TaxID=3154940 RepID=UPI00342B0D28
MALIQVLQGNTIPDPVVSAKTGVVMRTRPVYVPLKWVIIGKILKALGLAIAWAFTRWRLTGPAAILGYLYLQFDWPGPVIAVVTTSAALVAWWRLHRETYLRFFALPILARWRRRQLLKVWPAAMVAAGLDLSFRGEQVVPILRKVVCRPGVDLLTVRMVTGQIPADYAGETAERLAYTFGVRSVVPAPGRKSMDVMLTLLRGDPLAYTVKPLPITATPDFTRLPLALREDGSLWHLKLFGNQVLIVGATGSGKGSVLWSILRALAGGIASGLVKVKAFDPKGGMELAAGAPLFDEFLCDDYDAMADALEAGVKEMRARAVRLRGRTRQHTPTLDEPLYVFLIDELAALTAYCPDRKTKERIVTNLAILLTQGRAVGMHVIAAVQDPRKEAAANRDLFTIRIALRLAEDGHVDLVLGDGARDRGALADRIPESLPGVAYVAVDGSRHLERVRFSYLDDRAVTAMAGTYGRLGVIDGEIIPGDPDDQSEPS